MIMRKKHNYSYEGIIEKENTPSSDYCCYMTISKATQILNSGEVVFYPLDSTNDAKENGKKKTFALYFQSTSTEKVPLWGMYAGFEDGCRLRTTPGKIRSLINNLKEITVDNNSYYLGKDYKVLYGYCFYKDKKHFKYRNSYRVKKLFNENTDSLFLKDYAREYENEFRIVIDFFDECDFGEIRVKTPLYNKILLPKNYSKKLNITNKDVSISYSAYDFSQFNVVCKYTNRIINELLESLYELNVNTTLSNKIVDETIARLNKRRGT